MLHPQDAAARSLLDGAKVWMVLDIIAEAVRGRSATPSPPEMAEPQCKQMLSATA